jgi:hypothetical protein
MRFAARCLPASAQLPSANQSRPDRTHTCTALRDDSRCKVTPSELTEACLARIEVYNPKLNASVTVLRAQALVWDSAIHTYPVLWRFESRFTPNREGSQRTPIGFQIFGVPVG